MHECAYSITHFCITIKSGKAKIIIYVEAENMKRGFKV